jgi:GT2 family glycosyltransferase
MYKQPMVSVVLGSYNRYHYLSLAIESIRRELTDVLHEIIVVDGGSDDGALVWLAQQKDIITIVQHNRGEWLGKAMRRRSWGYFMNLGFKCAQGRYICMLSDDCLVVPGAINNGISLFDKELAGGRKLGALAFYWRDWSKDETYHVGYTLGEKLYVNHGMFLREALHDVGYVDEETCFFYDGDGDLCLKLWQQGYDVLEAPDSYIEHYPHANVAVRKTNYDRQRQDLKNYLRKWTGVFYDPRLNNLGKVQVKIFADVHKTACLFETLHQDVVQANPQLVKEKTALGKLYQRGIWVAHAIKRKIYSVFIR